MEVANTWYSLLKQKACLKTSNNICEIDLTSMDEYWLNYFIWFCFLIWYGGNEYGITYYVFILHKNIIYLINDFAYVSVEFFYDKTIIIFWKLFSLSNERLSFHSFLAQVSFFPWNFPASACPSVNASKRVFLTFYTFFPNHLAYFNQIWYNASLGEDISLL